MIHPIIHACDHYVVLEPGEKDQILTADETLKWLVYWLTKLDKPPKDLEVYSSFNDAAQHLLDTACSLEIKSGFNIEWFAVRLNPC